MDENVATDDSRAPSLDPDRHYAVLLGGAGPNMLRLKIACGAGSDVLTAQIRGGFIIELEEDGAVDWRIGPLLVECAKHGKYMALLQVLAMGPPASTGETPVSVPLLLIPWPNVETLLPGSMTKELLRDR